MNILIISGYTKVIKWVEDNNYVIYGDCDFGKLSSMNHLEYSHKHNYSYLCEVVDDGLYTDRHLSWVKINLIREKLPYYDYVVWIDSDAVFTNFDIKIEDFIKDNTDLVLPKMEIDRSHNKVWTSCSTGFMVWKNSEWSINMLNDLWDNPGEFRYNSFHEQGLLDVKLIDHYKLNYTILSKSFNDIKDPVLLKNVVVLPSEYQGCYYDSCSKFIYHASGDTYTKHERLKYILDGR